MSVDRADWPEAEAYFEGYADGRYDSDAHIDLICKVGDLRVSKEGDVLFFGRPGVDGIEFAFRRGSPAVWAYHPMESRWQQLAENIEQFEQGWKAGQLKV
ncbi:MAG: hypothetical protein KJO42_00475 [Silicimonas sp.]|nr:hypothetical protein [Silicimonas sp.]NNL71927.1 hypothetical protein [Silicimonas sp.]RZW10980.1 MAG: hypothetical protein EX266_02925 [Paracoccaceae bacterium]